MLASDPHDMTPGQRVDVQRAAQLDALRRERYGVQVRIEGGQSPRGRAENYDARLKDIDAAIRDAGGKGGKVKRGDVYPSPDAAA